MESTAIIMGRPVEETWVMNVGVTVVKDKNEDRGKLDVLPTS